MSCVIILASLSHHPCTNCSLRGYCCCKSAAIRSHGKHGKKEESVKRAAGVCRGTANTQPVLPAFPSVLSSSFPLIESHHLLLSLTTSPDNTTTSSAAAAALDCSLHVCVAGCDRTTRHTASFSRVSRVDADDGQTGYAVAAVPDRSPAQPCLPSSLLQPNMPGKAVPVSLDSNHDPLRRMRGKIDPRSLNKSVTHSFPFDLSCCCWLLLQPLLRPMMRS